MFKIKEIMKTAN